MRKFLILLGAILFCSLGAFAQTRVLTGRVTDDQGAPAGFASIQIKKSHKGVTADADGNFSIPVKPGDVLVITGTGFNTREIPVNGDSKMNITVARKSTSMTEVVVTALGQTTSKAKIGYATQTFSSSTINKNGVSGALDGLEGKIAGADISNTGGPGSSTKVVLRSYGVISGGDNQPLYVIDGVPFSDGIFQQNATGTDGVDFGNGMNNLNPNDIETITVLKGTAASSLYGSLAKNGAIIITTKRGKAGKLHVDFSGSANFSRVGKLPDYQSEFGQGWGGEWVPDENGSWGPRLDGKIRPWGAIVNGNQQEKPFVAIKNNVRDFYTTGSEYNNNLALSGGTETNRFYFSYGNVTSQGVIPGPADRQQRNTFALRTNSNYGRFAINTSFNFIAQDLRVPGTGQSTASGGGLFENLLQIPVDLPIKSFKNYNAPYNDVSTYFTPYAENPYYNIAEDGNDQKINRFFASLDMSYKFTDDFSAEFRLGGDFSNARTFLWKQVASALPNTWDGDPATNPEGASRTADIGQVSQGSDYLGTINGDFILKYVKDLSPSFNLNVLAGGNYYQAQQKSEFTTVTNLIIPDVFNLSNTNGPPFTTDATTLQRRVGLYAQATIGFKDQLFLTGNVRNDWSSTLPINANSIFYPGASLSWVASQLMGANSTVSFLKFRAAYGKTGSDPSPYLVKSSLGNGAYLMPFGSMQLPFNDIGGYGVSNTINNAQLKPITTKEAELGMEIRFLKDRVGLDATVYNKNTEGQIFPVFIAPSTGYTNYVENLGEVNNKGIELSLNIRPVETRNFTWNINYIFARDWNKVINLQGSQNPLLNLFYNVEMRAVVGKSVASLYAPVPLMSPSGQVVVDPNTAVPVVNTAALDPYGNPKGYLGTSLYTYTMGLTNTFTYKSFSLSGTLDFRYGGLMYSETADMVLFTGNSVATTYNDRKPFVIPNSVNAATDGSGKTTYTKNNAPIGGFGFSESDVTYAYYYTTGNPAMTTQQRMISRSFLKLRDINLTYSLPSGLAGRIKASNASLGIYARNLLLWTPKANVFVDPEATNLGNDLTGELGEFATAPLSKSIGIILKIGF